MMKGFRRTWVKQKDTLTVVKVMQFLVDTRATEAVKQVNCFTLSQIRIPKMFAMKSLDLSVVGVSFEHKKFGALLYYKSDINVSEMYYTPHTLKKMSKHS